MAGLVQINGNGGAYLNGYTPDEVRSQVITEAVGNLATAGLEAARKASGKSWFGFYGSIAWAWFKKNWLWLLIPLGGIIIIFKLLKWLKYKNRRYVGWKNQHAYEVKRGNPRATNSNRANWWRA